MIAVRQLAPKGVLRAAVNLANSLLVSDQSDGDFRGVAPDLIAWIAGKLSVPFICVPYANPSELLAEAGEDAWDICLIAADPARASTVAFTGPYAEIGATYLVRSASGITAIEDVDKSGVRIAAVEGSAYALWLSRELRNGSLVVLKSQALALDAFNSGEVDVVAGLRPNLFDVSASVPDVHLLTGSFMAIPQAVGTHRRNEEGVELLRAVVEEACSSGYISRVIEEHRVTGLNVIANQLE